MNAREKYTERKNERQIRVDRFESWERSISYARGAVFVIGAVMFWLAAGNRLFSTWWLAAPLVVFFALVLVHDRVIHAKDLALRSVRYYDRGLIRLDDGWPEGETPYVPEIAADHPYGADLDLFGRESVFERLSAARTESGRKILADWLLHPADPPIIRARQSAVTELRSMLDFREDLAVLGPDVPSALGSPMLRWASKPSAPVPDRIRAIPIALSCAALLTLYGWLVWDWNANVFAATLVLEYLFARKYRSLSKSVAEDLDRAGEELSLLLPVLVRLESESFASARLIELRKSLDCDGALSSTQIAYLRKLIEYVDSMRNPYFAPLGALLLWRTQFAFAVENWRARYGASVPTWLEAVGEIEALNSFAQTSFEHPEDPFPVITTEGPCFQAEELGHPLLPRNKCVRNTIRLDGELRLLVVSGSNMSGKSTLLRTVGVNAVLALAGATVFASRLEISPLALGVSLHIVDSLQAGASHFYAEILRLRALMDVSRGPLPLLFLLDEILHGTNSADRLTGAEAVVNGYLQHGGIGMITTHDLALARIVDALAPHAANVHFEDHMEAGRIAFDYCLRTGVIQKSNAIALMRAVGLEL